MASFRCPRRRQVRRQRAFRRDLSAAAGQVLPSAHRPAKVQPSRPKLGHDVLAIGDSVLVAASASLQQRLHGDITIDAVVGRQVWSGISRLAAYKAAGDLVGLKAIVIDLGTNGPMTPQDVERVSSAERQACHSLSS